MDIKLKTFSSKTAKDPSKSFHCSVVHFPSELGEVKLSGCVCAGTATLTGGGAFTGKLVEEKVCASCDATNGEEESGGEGGGDACLGEEWRGEEWRGEVCRGESVCLGVARESFGDPRDE